MRRHFSKIFNNHKYKTFEEIKNNELNDENNIHDDSSNYNKYALMKCYDMFNHIGTKHIVKEDTLENVYNILTQKLINFYSLEQTVSHVMYVIYKLDNIQYNKFNFYNFDTLTDEYVMIILTPTKISVCSGCQDFFIHFLEYNPAIREIYYERKTLENMSRRNVKNYIITHNYVSKKFMTKKSMIDTIMKDLIYSILKKYNMITI
jgi:predicted Fe-Mo cluster-binding NifX family protein|uniref:Uncharacterized protein n=1 Tax=Fadolivirus 2 TaxID=2740747 RepID=A0A7D3QWS3_9VIRU|nr:hypothetical protein Fadolivirus_2_13 [Fadolivirus 2]